MEILSPIKNLENASIAIKNGANALYLASPNFGARVNASIEIDEIKEIINLAKSYNVKTFVTFNIVIFENELENFFKQLDEIYLLGADAIILQDFSFIEIIKKFYPDLEVHSSTQMHIHNTSAVSLVKSLGSNRVVLPREMSFNKIKHIKANTNVDIEIFVHGALCVCYSGQCYDSTLLDQKSANRGRCSQYCRMPQHVIHKRKNKVVSSGNYPLNLKDLNNLDNLESYKNANIDSLKIEGRLKGIDYVGVTTKAYANKVNNIQDSIDLSDVYNRTFTHGRISSINGKELVNLDRPNNTGREIGKVIKVEKNTNKDLAFYKYIITITTPYEIVKGDNLRFINSDKEYGQEVEQIIKVNNNTFKVYSNEHVTDNFTVFRTKNAKLIRQFKEDIKNLEIQREKIFGSVYISQNGFNYEIVDSNKTYSFELKKDIDEAKNKATTQFDVQDILSKTKNTKYDIDFSLTLEENLFIPNKFLKELRNQIIKNFDILNTQNNRNSKLNEVLTFINIYNNKVCDFEEENNELKNPKIFSTTNNKNFYINCKTYNQIEAFNNLDNNQENYNIYLLLEFNLAKTLIDSKDPIFEILKDKYKLFLGLPKVIYDDEEDEILKYIKYFNNLCISELGSLKYTKYIDGEIISNFTLNTTNSININKLKSLGVDKQILSIELNKQKINEIATNNSIMYIYGRIPIMLMDYCPINLNKTDSCGNCTKCRNNDYYIEDKLGRQFPLVYEGNSRIGLYSKQILSLFNELSNTPAISNFFLNLTFEDTSDIDRIINSINESKNHINNSFKGNFYKETL